MDMHWTLQTLANQILEVETEEKCTNHMHLLALLPYYQIREMVPHSHYGVTM